MRIIQQCYFSLKACFITLGFYISSSLFFTQSALADDRSIDFWHWWNSAGEVQSIEVLNKYLTQNNINWEHKSPKNHSTNSYLNSFDDLIKAQQPNAAMMVSSGIQNYDTNFSLMHLDDIAQEQGWSDVIPYAIQATAKHQGHWVSAPINSHSTNWLWLNKALFSRLELPEPETWDDLIAILERAKALDIPVLAALNDDWEQALLFELVVISTGGLEFYRRLFVDQQPRDGDRYIFHESFLRLKQLTGFFADKSKNNTWNQNTALLADNQILMQVNGSWVDSELTALGALADIDYLCMPFPGTQGAYLFHSDHVIFFNAPNNRTEDQKQLARILLNKDFQRELSIASGASAVRVDISTEGFNSCGKKSIHNMRMANMRRAVMASLNNNDLFRIAHNYLQENITIETATRQVLTSVTQHAMPPSSSSQ